MFHLYPFRYKKEQFNNAEAKFMAALSARRALLRRYGPQYRDEPIEAARLKNSRIRPDQTARLNHGNGSFRLKLPARVTE